MNPVRRVIAFAFAVAFCLFLFLAIASLAQAHWYDGALAAVGAVAGYVLYRIACDE